MPQPNFRMQNIVSLRARQRDTAAGAYKEALAAKAKLQSQIDELLREHAAQKPLQTRSSGGQVNTQWLIESQRYQLHLLQQVGAINAQLELIDAECEKRRLNLVTKEQALRSLEKLREKKQAEWALHLATREQDALDQFANFQHWKES